MSTQTNGNAFVKKRYEFSYVSIALLERADLSPISRLILIWAFTKPNLWQFHISHLTRVLGISDLQWHRAKKELVSAGFFSQSKQQNSAGKLVWINEFTDALLYPG